MLRELCRTPYALNRASNRTLPSVWFQLVKHDKDLRQGIGDLEKHIVTLDRVAELPDADREQQIRLALAVYPNSDADWSGRNLEWSEPEWCVQVRDLAGSLVSFVGVHCRDVLVDGHPVKVGGIGNVKTHPDARRQGFASEGIRCGRILSRASKYRLRVVSLRTKLGWVLLPPRLERVYGAYSHSET